MVDSTVLLIRYGELTLKSKGIRSIYENMLINQIKNLLMIHNVKHEKIKRDQGRLFIYFDKLHISDLNKTICILSKIFGIYSISSCFYCTSEIKNILDLCILIGDQKIKETDTFGVKVRKSCEYIYTSQEVSKICGDAIWMTLKNKGYNPKVNLTNPTIKVCIEIRKEETYIYFEKIKCLGGFPVGTQGKMIALLSSGIDSPVAAWLMMKRGVEIIPLFIDNGKYGSKINFEKVKENAKILFSYSPKKINSLYYISNEEYMELIIKKCSEKNRCILCKRSMFIIANEMRKHLNAVGIITGSSLGQVASQTAKNMISETYNLSLPIYHPLISFDKQEIVDLAKKIGTYENSIKLGTSEDCKAVPKKPEIGTDENIVLLEEKKIGNYFFDKNEKIINNYKTIKYNLESIIKINQNQL